MSTWEFGCDESGTFDHRERSLFLVGGVLLPNSNYSRTLVGTLKTLCRAAGVQFPPHATALRAQQLGSVVEQLLEATMQWLEESDGTFLAVACRPGTQSADCAMHARMLGGLVETAGRMVAASGGTRLALHPASRGFELEKEAQAAAYRRSGILAERRTQSASEPPTWHVRGVIGGELRETLDGLRRSSSGWLAPFPGVEYIDVRSAANDRAHATVLASDLLCNAVYRKFRAHPTLSASQLNQRSDWTSARINVVDFCLLREVRAVDEALRRSPPSLYAMAEAWERVRVRAKRTELGLLHAGVDGSLQLIEQLWLKAERRFATAVGKTPEKARALAQRLISDVRSELDMKHGAYEPASRALRLGFFGPGALAQSARSLPDDELVAQLHAATLQCENHRGNVEVARRSYQAFANVYANNCSLSLSALALQVENRANVLEQNELPALADRAESQMSIVAERAEALLECTERTYERVRQPARHSSPSPDEVPDDEKRLRKLIQDDKPAWLRRDRGHGHAYGTASRSLAFCGKLGEALEAALHSRRFFAESPLDLKINACNLARIRAEQGRLGQLAPADDLLQCLVEMAGGAQMRKTHVALKLLKHNGAERFSLDILLRQLRWNSNPTDTPHAQLLTDAGAEHSKLFGFLNTQRSHPTELIARHLAELLVLRNEPAAADRWFQLSVELTEDAGNTTLGRFTPFTRALREGRAAEGPPGSLLNPTFEYR